MEGGKAFLMFETPGQALIIQKLSGIKLNGNRLNINFTTYRKGVNEQRQGNKSYF
jgi:hypothetical protein